MRPGLIYVDSRVGSKELAPALSGPRHRLQVKLATLNSADFAFTCGHTETNPFCRGDHGCTIGVERKVLSDMVSSLTRGRFDQQLPSILEDYTMAWVVVEGIWRPAADDAIEVPHFHGGGGWRPAGCRLSYSQLSSWMVRYDVFARGRLARWRTSSITETAAFVASVFHWWQKEWKRHHLERVIGRTAKPLRTVMFRPTKMQVLARELGRGLGVGDEAAKKVGRSFRSVGEMFAAGEERWRAAGLTKKQAEKVVAEIGKPYR